MCGCMNVYLSVHLFVDMYVWMHISLYVHMYKYLYLRSTLKKYRTGTNSSSRKKDSPICMYVCMYL